MGGERAQRSAEGRGETVALAALFKEHGVDVTGCLERAEFLEKVRAKSFLVCFFAEAKEY